LLKAESTEEVEALKTQMHISEVDLNYTQYYPLSEPYVSLYPQKDSKTGEPDTSELTAKPKPSMWVEVERCMEHGTLNALRNRVARIAPTSSKQITRISAKPKPKPTPVDTTGLNRRERRSQRGAKEARTKNKSMAFAKNEAFGASQGMEMIRSGPIPDDDSDGGFFED